MRQLIEFAKRFRARGRLTRARFLRLESLDQRIAFDVNQPPVNVVPGPQTFTADSPTVTFGTLNRVSTHDPDAGSLDLRVTLFVNRGTISLGSTAGLTFLNGGNNTRYLLFDGSEDEINNALLNMQYTANDGTTSDTLTLDVHDLGHTGTGGAKTDRDAVTLTRATGTVNQAPVNTVPGPQTYGSSGDLTFEGTNSISTFDPDAGNLNLRMTLFVNGGTLSLGSTSGLSFFRGGNNTRYMVFDGTQAEIDNALDGLVYHANSGVNSDTLTVDTHDLGHSGSGGAKTDRDTVLLNRVGVFPNQAPVNTVPGAQTYNSTSRTVTFGAGNRVSTHDVDANGQNLRVTLFVNRGVINLSTTSGLTFISGGTNTRYMVFDGTEANINNALLNMTYTANIGSTSDVFTIDTHDLGHSGTGGAKTDRDSFTLTQAGTHVNQAPFNTVPGPQTYGASSRQVTFGAINRVQTSDSDAGNLDVRVTLFVNGGVINLPTTSGLSFLNGGNNTRYLLFDGNLTSVNNAMMNMTYTANSGTTSDTFTIDVHDLGHTGTGGAKTDRDSVSLTQVGITGRTGGGGSGESTSANTAAPSSTSDVLADGADAIFAEAPSQQSATMGASLNRLIDLLASSNSGRVKTAAKPIA